MIINAEQSDVQVLGDIKEFKTSIDPKNLEFITTLLSSNLYSDPEQSFIREIVSNAWDSHVEAGTTDVPVIIRFKHDSNGWEVAIRDFGTGLSPERFQEVYCNIGSSTKRESNEFIGGFGIGKYSSLACSNTVYITSYYKGTAYIYVMVKSGNCITTNLVMEKPTEEKNGVEVAIKNIKSIHAYTKALRYITFFPNVYVDGIENDINKTKLKKFNNFAVASIEIGTKILLGNVLYPCNNSLLSYDSREFLDKIETTGIVIKFDIGELKVTPNRENILYNSETIKKIEDRIEAAKNELDDMVKKKFAKDYDNLHEYWCIIRKRIEYFPIDDSYQENVYYRRFGYITKVDPSILTFKGTKDLKDIPDTLDNFFYMEHINFKGLFHNGKFYQTKIPSDSQPRTQMGVKKVLMLTGGTRLTAIAKEWLYDNYSDYTVVTKFTKEELRSYLFAHITNFKYKPNVDVIVGYMYDYLMSKITPMDIENNADFQEYKVKAKANKVPTVRIKDFIIYVQRNTDYRERMYFKSMSDCVDYIKRQKKGIILTDLQDSDIWFSVAEARGFMFIRARKEIVEALNEAKLSFLVDKEWLLTEDPVIVKLHTILQTFGDGSCPTKHSSYEMMKTVPIPLREGFMNIIEFYYKYSGNDTYRSLARTKCTKVDPYVDYLCKELKKHCDIYNSLSIELGIPINGENPLKGMLMTAVIVKSKAYRINPKAYSTIKNNKLLRVLCRK